MFTIKYRYFTLAQAQSCEGPFYDQNESLHGPFNTISQFRDENSNLIVNASKDSDLAGSMTFGPVVLQDSSAVLQASPPRPILWVMNESGSTVAKYDL